VTLWSSYEDPSRIARPASGHVRNNAEPAQGTGGKGHVEALLIKRFHKLRCLPTNPLMRECAHDAPAGVTTGRIYLLGNDPHHHYCRQEQNNPSI
jgi:hypothetical protein